MFRFRKAVGILAIGAVFAVSGCDTPTDPQPASVEPELGLLGTVTGLLGSDQPVRVLERTERLAQDIRVTQTIGRSGGTIRIPEAGLTVIVPRRALHRDTEITVTAPAGDLVGYHFAPHGLRFARSVTIRQDLSKTEASLLTNLLGGLKGAYFLGDLKPHVIALELLDLNLLDLLLAQFRIDHFSGYVIATD